MRNSQENERLLSPSESTTDVSTISYSQSEVPSLSFPKTGSPPPPSYHLDDIPRRPVSPSARSATPTPVQTEPWEASHASISTTLQNRPIINIYSKNIYEADLNHVLASAQTQGSAAPIVNVCTHKKFSHHMEKLGRTLSATQSNAEQCLEMGRLDAEEVQARHKRKLQMAQLFCGCFLGFIGIIIGGFAIWAIAEAVVRISLGIKGGN